MTDILVLYYSQNGSTEHLAQAIAVGVASHTQCTARIRTAPTVSATSAQSDPAIPTQGPPYITMDDFTDCAGYLIGCPTHFGNMPAALKHVLDQTVSIWQSGAMENKPVGFFTSSSSHHGGQETTLLSMMLPFIHHGALIVGVPYSETALLNTTTGGTPYGASHVSQQGTQLSKHEKQIAHTLGARVADIAYKLNG